MKTTTDILSDFNDAPQSEKAKIIDGVLGVFLSDYYDIETRDQIKKIRGNLTPAKFVGMAVEYYADILTDI